MVYLFLNYYLYYLIGLYFELTLRVLHGTFILGVYKRKALRGGEAKIPKFDKYSLPSHFFS